MDSTQSSFAYSSSSHSSDEAASHRNSSETRLTRFSPEDPRGTAKASLGSFDSNDSERGLPSFTLDPDHYQLPSYLRSPLPPKVGPVREHGQPQEPGRLALTLPESAAARAVSTLGEQKLSPTAASFTPTSSEFDSHATLPNHSGLSSSSLGAAAAFGSSDAGFLTPISVPAVNATDSARKFDNVNTSEQTPMRFNGHRVLHPAGTPSRRLWSASPTASTEGMIVRAFIISNIAKTVSASLLKEYFNTYLFPSLKGPMLIDLNSAGVIYLGFSDVVDSDAAIHKARTLCPEWNVEMFSPTQLAHKFGSMPLSNEDGQLVVKAFFAGPPADFSPTAVEQLLLELLSNYGDVLSYQSLHDNEANTICLVVEFDDKYTAESAARALNGFKIQGCRLSIPGSNPNSGAVAASRRIELAHGGSEIDSAFNRLSVSSRQYSRNEQAGRLVGRGYVRLSPTGRSTLPPEDLPNSWTSDYAYTQPNLSRGRSRPEPLLSSGNVGRYREDHRSPGPWEVHGAIGQERSQLQHLRFPHIANSSSRQLTTKLTGRCDQDFASGHHNVVDIERIRRGLDVRTTIMLRNIPNKIDQAMLKDIVDETSIGKYDFMYLRIDFANNCNVGYAFINFEDPYFIIDFVETRAGRRWNRFNSDKVAEVSYATIQGKDCLVQKFRNSSVMLEHPSFRPKIFHTGTSPLAGKEDAFPCPDNPSKMRRSVENAEHVGLFAPRAGQQNRDEQRRRRSQFDRGTRLAEYEEAYEYDSQDDDDNYHSQDLRYGPLEERPLAHRTSRYGMSY